jgi:hypothetical protein
MPLYDHFHGPHSWRLWELFHGRWAVAISDESGSLRTQPDSRMICASFTIL